MLLVVQPRSSYKQPLRGMVIHKLQKLFVELSSWISLQKAKESDVQCYLGITKSNNFARNLASFWLYVPMKETGRIALLTAMLEKTFWKKIKNSVKIGQILFLLLCWCSWPLQCSYKNDKNRCKDNRNIYFKTTFQCKRLYKNYLKGL